MENKISMSQLQAKLGLDSDSLRDLLCSSGVTPSGDSLGLAQIRTVLDFLGRENAKRERWSREKLLQLVGQNTVIIDTCSLLSGFDDLCQVGCPGAQEVPRGWLRSRRPRLLSCAGG